MRICLVFVIGTLIGILSSPQTAGAAAPSTPSTQLNVPCLEELYRDWKSGCKGYCKSCKPDSKPFCLFCKKWCDTKKCAEDAAKPNSPNEARISREGKR